MNDQQPRRTGILRHDDLRPGIWVVVTRIYSQEESASDWIYGGEGRRHQPQAMTGVPHYVKAVSLPFVLLHCQGQAMSFDTRDLELRVADPKYVKAYLASLGPRPGPHGGFTDAAPPAKRKRKKKEKPDARKCQRCGTRMLQQLKAGSDWKWHCPNCGNDGDVVKLQPVDPTKPFGGTDFRKVVYFPFGKT